jgi:hypothetical protein
MHFGLSVVIFTGTPPIWRSRLSIARSVVTVSIAHTRRTIRYLEYPKIPANIHNGRLRPVTGSLTSRSFPQSNSSASPGACRISGTTR